MSRLMVPGVQLAAAALAFVLWFRFGAVAPLDLQVTPARSFGFGSVLGLVIPLGLPYLVPNLYRGTTIEQRRGHGEWSDAISFTVAALVTSALLGATWTVVAPESTLGPSVGVGAMIGMGITIAQVARARSAVPLMAVGASLQVLVPTWWLVAGALRPAFPHASVTFGLLASASVALSACSIRSQLRRGRRGGLRGQLRLALPVVPHLLAFGVLVQGLRLASAASGQPGLALEGHYLMLALSAGLALLMSGHAMVAVEAQAMTDEDLASGTPRYVRDYLLLSTGSGLGTVIALWAVVEYLAPVHMAYPTWVWILLCSVVPVLGIYFSFSTMLLRGNRTRALATSSLVALALAVLGSLLVPGHLAPLVAVYFSAILLLLGMVVVQQGMGERRPTLLQLARLAPAVGPSALLAVLVF